MQLLRHVFRSYFTQGLDISDRRVLIDIATTAGLPSLQVEHFLESNGGIAEVQQEEAAVHQLGISGVPFFIINKKYRISDAQSGETLVAAFDQANVISAGK